MDQILVLRIFEAACLGIFLAVVWWVMRQRKPLYAGVLLASSILAGLWMEWVYNTRWMWNMRWNPDFIPLYEIRGEALPFVAPITYAYGQSIFIFWLIAKREAMPRSPWMKYGLIFLLGGVTCMVGEIPIINIVHSYIYYQKPEFLFLGWPWSNFWMAGFIYLFAFLFLEIVLDLMPAASRPADQLSRKEQIGVAMAGFAATAMGYQIAALIQMPWYGFVQPWIDSPRTF